jgi:hypothetical protein
VSFPVLSQIKPQAPVYLENQTHGLSATDGLYLKPDENKKTFRTPPAHTHLVSEPFPVKRDLAADSPLHHLTTLLPYPRRLTWPPTSFENRLGSLSFRGFPQFEHVAHHTDGLVRRQPFRASLLGAETLRRAAMFTPGGALPSIPLSFSLATILPPEPKNFDFS